MKTLNNRSRARGSRSERDMVRLIETCRYLDKTRADDESEVFNNYQRAVEAYASRYHKSIAEVEQLILSAVVM